MKYIITESQYQSIKESLEKNKKFLIKTMGVDLTDNIQMVNSRYDVPTEFDEGISPDLVRRMLNNWGPMYLFNLNGKDYLYQDRGEYEWFIDTEGFEFVDNEIIEKLGVDVLGMDFSDLIKVFYTEDQSINESTEKDYTSLIDKFISEYDFPDYFKGYNIGRDDDAYKVTFVVGLKQMKRYQEVFKVIEPLFDDINSFIPINVWPKVKYK
jgi:hypothetical protein